MIVPGMKRPRIIEWYLKRLNDNTTKKNTRRITDILLKAKLSREEFITMVFYYPVNFAYGLTAVIPVKARDFPDHAEIYCTVLFSTPRHAAKFDRMLHLMSFTPECFKTIGDHLSDQEDGIISLILRYINMNRGVEQHTDLVDLCKMILFTKDDPALVNSARLYLKRRS